MAILLSSGQKLKFLSNLSKSWIVYSIRLTQSELFEIWSDKYLISFQIRVIKLSGSTFYLSTLKHLVVFSNNHSASHFSTKCSRTTFVRWLTSWTVGAFALVGLKLISFVALYGIFPLLCMYLLRPWVDWGNRNGKYFNYRPISLINSSTDVVASIFISCWSLGVQHFLWRNMKKKKVISSISTFNFTLCRTASFFSRFKI